MLGKLHNLVRHAVRHIRARGDARIGTQNHAVFKGDCHDGGSGGDFSLLQSGIVIWYGFKRGGVLN
eukprot:scaffold31414_cov183-Amphora_coffeaeformis.AAC.3